MNFRKDDYKIYNDQLNQNCDEMMIQIKNQENEIAYYKDLVQSDMQKYSDIER